MTPSGVLLGAINDRRPEMIQRLLKDSLDKWARMPKALRLRAAPPARDDRKYRSEDSYPEGGLALRSHSRDFSGGDNPTDGKANAWNTDVVWFDAEEYRAIALTSGTKGHRQALPDGFARRIARMNFVDNVRGQTITYDDGHVEKASVTLEVAGVEKGQVRCTIRGEAKAVRRGRWSVWGHDERGPAEQERGCDLKILGRARFDPAKGRYTQFEIVAVGTRRGGTQYNRREEDLAASPWGVELTIADDRDRVAPSNFGQYPWR